MDTALELKIKADSQLPISPEEAQDALEQSELFQALLKDFEPRVLDLLWRLTQLSEIPFTGQHPKIKVWLDQLLQATYTDQGFSLNGTDDYMLACYNGMITSLLIKLGYPDTSKIEKGIRWILDYQHTQRGEVSKWQGQGMKKYGGCMKEVPCYIGMVKSMTALSDYKHAGYGNFSREMDLKLSEGLEYILDQEIFLRRSDRKPITKEITKLTYPFTYKVNIIEILRLLRANGLSNDPRCSAAKEYLKGKQKQDGSWWAQSSSINKNKVWIPFDPSRQPGHWISHEILSVAFTAPYI